MSGAASPSTHRERDANDTGRAQSSVVGVALLLGATVVALGVLTASIGTLVDGQAARSDAERVAADFEGGLRPVETTGHRASEVRFADGDLRTVKRELRVLDGSGVVQKRIAVGALVYEHGEHRVTSVAGAVVRSRGETAWLVSEPPIAGSKSTGVLVVGAAKLNASDVAVGGSRTTVHLESNVSHERTAFSTGRYGVAVETETPAVFERYFEERGASVSRRHYDSDGVPSVVASFPGRRRAYLVVHDMRLEVDSG